MILKINIKPVLPFAHVRILIDRHIAVHVKIVHYSDPPPHAIAPAYQRMDKTRHFFPYSVQKEYLFNSKTETIGAWGQKATRVDYTSTFVIIGSYTYLLGYEPLLCWCEPVTMRTSILSFTDKILLVSSFKDNTKIKRQRKLNYILSSLF